MSIFNFFFFKQKTAYEVRISDWSSDVCSSDLSEWMVNKNPRNRVPSTHFRNAGCTTVRSNRPRMDSLLSSLKSRNKSAFRTDRKSVVRGKSGSVRVDLGGGGIIKKKIRRRT